MKRSLLVLFAGSAVASLCLACGGRDLNAGSGPNGGGNDGGGLRAGVVTIASEIQLPPSNLVSDGTSLFWVTSTGAGGPVWSMPVAGGPITTVVPGMIGGGFLAVDDVNVYYLGQGGIYRAPKSGAGSPALINEAGGSPGGVTSLGENAYWLEVENPGASSPLVAEAGPTPSPATNLIVAVKSAPLKGGAVSLIAQFTSNSGLLAPQLMGVSTTTVVLSWPTGQLAFFPLPSGVPDGGMPASVPGPPPFGCEVLFSDTSAVYCENSSSLFRIANDGTLTMLGPVVTGLNNFLADNVATDDTYVYWADSTTVGTIMRVPKAGGAFSTLARETVPLAIAVDANAVYWSDQGGNIIRLAK